MSDTYSILLGLALVITIASASLFLLSRLRRFGNRSEERISYFGHVMGILGLLVCSLAGVLHFVTDHSESSTNPMRLGSFFAEHPAILIIGILAIALAIGPPTRN